MSDTILKPCPFCGRADSLQFETFGDVYCTSVTCDNCHSQGPSIQGDDQKEIARVKWNERLGSSEQIDEANKIIQTMNRLGLASICREYCERYLK